MILGCGVAGASSGRVTLECEMQGDNSIWSPLQSLFTIAGGAILGGSTFFFLGAVDAYVKENHDKIDAVPDDVEVAEYDRAQVCYVCHP